MSTVATTNAGIPAEASANPVAAPSPDASSLSANRPDQLLVHLQIFRAVGASLVILDHSFGTLASFHLVQNVNMDPGQQLGKFALYGFFVLSGFIMMRQSNDQFALPNATARFARHRIVRVVPIYWIATVLWFATLAAGKRLPTSPLKQLLLSLFFIPNYVATTTRGPFPLLTQGWTLNYEMAFYLLFAIALLFGRKIGVAILLLVPVVLSVIGAFLPYNPIATLASVPLYYTQPVVLLFAAGVLLSVLDTRFHLPRYKLPISPAFLLLLPAPWLLSGHAGAHAVALYESVRYPLSIALVVACVLAVNPSLNLFHRTLLLMGEASYSTYVFHLWALTVTVPLAVRVLHLLHIPISYPYLLAILTVTAGNLLGIVIHLFVELPITRALRKRNGTTNPIALPAS